MKRPLLVLLSLFATGGFGYWLVTTPHTRREILLACAGWVLGFWVAAAIQGRRRRQDARHDEAGLAEDDEADWEGEDGWEDEA